MSAFAAVRDLLAAGRFDAALKALAEAPSGHERAVLAAAAHVGRKEGRKALAALADAQAGHPDTLFQTGRALLLASNAHGAVQCFESLPAAHPGLAEALAGAYRRDARFADAVRIAEQAGLVGRQLRYEHAMALLGMGDAQAALDGFDAILEHWPDHAASWQGSAGPALDVTGAADCLRRLERAAACPGVNGKVWGMLAALHLVAGDGAEAARIRAAHVTAHPRRRALVDGIEALAPHMAADMRVLGMSKAVLDHALSLATVPGLVLEFGVRRGTSINHIAAAAGQQVHGFDSFEGLPADWIGERAGVLTTGNELPPVRDNVTLHAGWFDDTIAPFLAGHDGMVRLVNIDSDIYASARTVLTHLAPRMGAGTIVVFDEMIGNRTWRDDEYRAFMEFIAASGFGWEVMALSPFTKQVVVKLYS